MQPIIYHVANNCRKIRKKTIEKTKKNDIHPGLVVLQIHAESIEGRIECTVGGICETGKLVSL